MVIILSIRLIQLTLCFNGGTWYWMHPALLKACSAPQSRLPVFIITTTGIHCHPLQGQSPGGFECMACPVFFWPCAFKFEALEPTGLNFVSPAFAGVLILCCGYTWDLNTILYWKLLFKSLSSPIPQQNLSKSSHLDSTWINKKRNIRGRMKVLPS